MSEIKEFDIPESLIPRYNKDYTELIFSFPSTFLSRIKFKTYFISNNGKPGVSSSLVAKRGSLGQVPTKKTKWHLAQ